MMIIVTMMTIIMKMLMILILIRLIIIIINNSFTSALSTGGHGSNLGHFVPLVHKTDLFQWLHFHTPGVTGSALRLVR